MALINAASTSPQAIYNSAIAKLRALQVALRELHEEQLWLAGVAAADLIAIGAVQADIDALKSAVADADALVQLYDAGTLAGGYALPYVFGASQRRFIGPP